MTSYVVNTYLQDVTQNLTGTGDDLLVTSAGSLVETAGEVGVNSTGDFEAITVDGLVYGAVGNAVSITGSETTLFVNGQVQGGEGVSVNNAAGHDSVNVGSQGSIESCTYAVVFEGNTSSPAATNDRVSNAGDISAGLIAVLVASGGGDLINNTGLISGEDGIFFDGNVATETVENSGTIEGALFFDDLSGTTSLIDNEGTITGSGFVISSDFDILDINNSGTIHGGLNSVSTVDVENSGHWHDGTGSGGVVFSLSGAGNSLTNAQAGTITGAISISGTATRSTTPAGSMARSRSPPGTMCSPTRARSTGRSRSPGPRSRTPSQIPAPSPVTSSSRVRIARLPTPVRSLETSPRPKARIR